MFYTSSLLLLQRISKKIYVGNIVGNIDTDALLKYLGAHYDPYRTELNLRRIELGLRFTLLMRYTRWADVKRKTNW